MAKELPQSILFCCDHNAVRSPMAEGLMKKYYGTQAYVQSAGVVGDLDIDGFSIAVCKELGIELSRHQTRSFDEMEEGGEEIASFDMVVALSPTSQKRVLELTKYYSLSVEYWPIVDPTALGDRREEKMDAYRQARDQISNRLIERFGPPIIAN